MNHSSGSHSRMFLMELIVAILFFSLASAVCLRMFAASRQMSQDTTQLNMAMNQAGNTAELLKHAWSAQEAFPDGFLNQYPYAIADKTEIAVYFDENWNHCTVEDGFYYMQIMLKTETDGITPCQIAVWDTTDNESAIYSLDLKLHMPIQP